MQLTEKDRTHFEKSVLKTDKCWLWQRKLKKDSGYGTFYVKGKQKRAHCVAYELYVGEIPAGFTIDHLCRVRHCVNPNHLEPVTRGENVKRGEAGKYQTLRTECPKGHKYDEENTFTSKQNKRICRKCARARYLQNKEKYNQNRRNKKLAGNKPN